MLHVRAADDAAAVDAVRDVWRTALDIVVRHGGVIGHHHGIGAVRGAAYRAGDEGVLHARLRDALDPGRVLRAPLLDGDG
jgi:FAD/FMN-containing dehydrogenase